MFQVTTCGASQVFEVTNMSGGRLKAQLFMPLQHGFPEIEVLIKDGLEVNPNYTSLHMVTCSQYLAVN